MTDHRQKNGRWQIPSEGRTWEHVQVAVLMDIRDELQQINRLLACHRIPKALDAVVAMHKQGVKRRVTRKRTKRAAK